MSNNAGAPGGIQTYTFSNFSGGLNLLLQERSLPQNSVIDCSNVEFLKSGFIAKANGYESFGVSLNGSSRVNGLYNFIKANGNRFLLKAEGTKLYYTTDDTNWTEIYGSLDPNKRVRFSTFADTVIIVNGTEILEWDGVDLTASAPSWWTNPEIPSIAEVHRNRLWFSGSSSKPYRIWHSGIGALIFDTSDTINTGTGTISTKTTATTTGTGTITTTDLPKIRTGSGLISGATTTITGVGTNFTSELSVGDSITVGAQTRVVTAIASTTSMTINAVFSPSIASQAFTYQKILGAKKTGLGTVSVTGTAVTGTSTLFSTEFIVGDRLYIGNDYAVVSAIASNTSMTLTTAMASNYAGQSYQVLRRITGTVTTSSTGVVGQSGISSFSTQLTAGDALVVGDEERVIGVVGDLTTCTLLRAFNSNYTGQLAYVLKPSEQAVFGSTDSKFLSEAMRPTGSTTDYKIIANAETRNILAVATNGLLEIDTPFTTPLTNASFQITKPVEPKTTIIGTGTAFQDEVALGDSIKTADGQIRQVIRVVSQTEITIAAAFDPDITTGTYQILKPNANPGDAFDVNNADGQSVTAIKTYAENLVIWKTGSIFQIQGSTNAAIVSSPDPFRVVPVSTSTGAINQDSITPIKNDILFVNEFGVNALSLVDRLVQPVATQLLSNKIQPLIDNWNIDQLNDCFSVHHRAKTQVWFFVPSTSSSVQNDKVLVLDYELSNWSVRDGFVGAAGFNYKNKPLIGDYAGALWNHDTGTSYNGAAIESYLTTPWLSLDDNYTTNKHILWMNLTYVKYGDWDIDLDIGINFRTSIRNKSVNISPGGATGIWDATAWDNSEFGGTEVDTVKLSGGFGTGHTFNFKFSNNGIDEPYLIQGFDLFSQILTSHGPTYNKL